MRGKFSGKPSSCCGLRRRSCLLHFHFLMEVAFNLHGRREVVSRASLCAESFEWHDFPRVFHEEPSTILHPTLDLSYKFLLSNVLMSAGEKLYGEERPMSGNRR
jgi:hypothetical protein